MRAPSTKWTPEEDAILRTCTTLREAERKIAGRSGRAARARALLIGHQFLARSSYSRKPWTADEVAIIRACATRQEMIAALPHRTPGAIDNAVERYRSHEPRDFRMSQLVTRICLRCRRPTRVPRPCFLCEPCRKAATEDMPA